jgi:hypothetical protein
MKHGMTIFNGLAWGIITILHTINFGYTAGAIMFLAMMVIMMYTFLYEDLKSKIK